MDFVQSLSGGQIVGIVALVVGALILFSGMGKGPKGSKSNGNNSNNSKSNSNNNNNNSNNNQQNSGNTQA